MRKNAIGYCLGVMSIAIMAGCAATPVHFGEPMKLKDVDTVPVAKVIANPSAYDGKFIRVAGKVASVCEAKGCWLRMSESGQGETLFVKFTCPVDGRLIPMDAVGHSVVVEGTLKVEQMSEAEAKHYAEDAGKPAAEIAKIVGPQKNIRIASPAAEVAGIKKSA